MENVILVNDNDDPIGSMEKLEVHQKGLLHRAFSVLVFNTAGELLLQKRSRNKYHSGGLWTNTCCSHPQPGEKIEDAVRRRLFYEMGIEVNPEFAYKFIYEAALDKGLIEHEYDHVFFATFDGHPHINHDEVEDWKYVTLHYLRENMQAQPENYTYWFRLIINHPQLTALLV